jgi:hypothetical protein
MATAVRWSSSLVRSETRTIAEEEEQAWAWLDTKLAP